MNIKKIYVASYGVTRAAVWLTLDIWCLEENLQMYRTKQATHFFAIFSSN